MAANDLSGALCAHPPACLSSPPRSSRARLSPPQISAAKLVQIYVGYKRTNRCQRHLRQARLPCITPSNSVYPVVCEAASFLRSPYLHMMEIDRPCSTGRLRTAVESEQCVRDPHAHSDK